MFSSVYKKIAVIGRDKTFLYCGILTIPIFAAMFHALRIGWQLEGDNAIIAIRAAAVFSKHPPLLGMPSTLSNYAPGYDANHLGPIQFFLQAIPYYLFGKTATGMVLGSGLINLVSLVYLGKITKKFGSKTFQQVTLLSILLLCWGLGPTILIDPFNPYQSLLPFTLFLWCCWFLSNGKNVWSIFLISASFVLQSQLSFIIPVLGLGGVSCALFFIEKKKFVFSSIKQHLSTWIITTLLLLLCWVPPIWQQLFHEKKNLSALYRAFFVSYPTVGLVGARRVLAHLFTIPPLWGTRGNTPIGLVLQLNSTQRVMLIAVIFLIFISAIAGLRNNEIRSLTIRILTISLCALGTILYGLGKIPFGASLADYNQQWIRPFGAFLTTLWAVLMYERIRKSIISLSVKREDSAVPSTSSKRKNIRYMHVLGYIVPVIVLGACNVPPTPIEKYRGNTFTSTIASVWEQLPHYLDLNTTYYFQRTGYDAFTSVGPEILRRLDNQGFEITAPDETIKAVGEKFRISNDTLPTQTIWLISGTDITPPAGDAKLLFVVGDGFTEAETEDVLQTFIIKTLIEVDTLTLSKKGEAFFRPYLEKNPDQTQSYLDDLLTNPEKYIENGAFTDAYRNGYFVEELPENRDILRLAHQQNDPTIAVYLSSYTASLPTP